MGDAADGWPAGGRWKALRPIVLTLLVGLLAAAEQLTPERIRAIDLSGADDDDGWVAPVAANLDHLAGNAELRADLDGLVARLDAWPDAVGPDLAARTFTLLNAVSLVDMGRGSCEAEFAWTVFDRLVRLPDREAVRQATASIILGLDGRMAQGDLPELGLSTGERPEAVRTRMTLHAKKLLIRLNGPTP